MSRPSQQSRSQHHQQSSIAADSATYWVIEPRNSSALYRLVEAWRYRYLLGYFAGVALERVYKRTLLGRLWLILRPVIPVAISTLVFHQLAGVQAGETPYLLFAFVGSSIWGFFEESLMWMTRSFQINKGVLKRLYFPRIILPIASTAPAFLDLGIYLLIICIINLYYLSHTGTSYITIRPELALALVATILTVFFALSIGLFTSILGAEHRDVRFTLSYVLRFWYFLTPVVYPLDLIPEQWRWLSVLNPMTPIVELFKLGILGTGGDIDVHHVIATVLVIVCTLASGIWFFTKTESASIDRL